MRPVQAQSPLTEFSKSQTAGEAAGQADISIAWKQAPEGGKVKKASETLAALVTNNTDAVQQGRIILTALGLDGRKAGREVQKFILAARASSEVSIPISSLPIQSEVAPSSAVLEVELNRGNEVFRPSKTRQTYYIFGSGYAQAQLYNHDEVTKLPNRGLLTTDVMNVNGRVLDGTGALQVLDPSTVALTPGPRQGLTRMGVKRARPSDSPSFGTTSTAGTNLAPTPAAPAGYSTTQAVQAFLWVNYTDSGFGEDVLPLSGWQLALASYMWVLIASPDFSTTYYYGTLDRNGRNYGTLNLPPDTLLVAHLWTDWQIDENGTQFDSLNCDTNLICGPSESDTYFTTGPEGSGSQTAVLNIAIDTEAGQTAAVAGLILQTSNNNNNSLGIWPGSLYRIHANLGCPIVGGGYDPLKSCFAGESYNPEVSYLYFGTQSGGYNQASGMNEPGAWWKYIIAHEIGHAMQFRDLGVLGALDYQHGDELYFFRVCRCDNVTSAKEHCLNSKEDFNVGEIEGFAHFYATRVFNWNTEPNAKMVYYKQFQNSNAASDYTNPPMAKDGFGNIQRRWMQTKCPAGRAGRGNEWDFLQFYYDIGSEDSGRAGKRTDLSYLKDIYHLACTGYVWQWCNQTTNPTWQNLRDSSYTYYTSPSYFINDIEHYNRFNAALSYHGVNN